ncbi:hypothetical protein HDN1F_02760 [gamma proteobacterium HdN1]|nr:hypothetical protein HDN1F_02760 [gamma proteobacterium HdN1]
MDNEKFLRVLARILLGIGALFYLLYAVYLPLPQWFEAAGAERGNTGILFYCLATAGAAFVVWGILLGKLGEQGLGRKQVLSASAIGLGMLALMRLGTVLFPHPPFDGLVVVPAIECVVFALVAIKLYRA